jgi:hypothetical protein
MRMEILLQPGLVVDLTEVLTILKQNFLWA